MHLTAHLKINIPFFTTSKKSDLVVNYAIIKIFGLQNVLKLSLIWKIVMPQNLELQIMIHNLKPSESLLLKRIDSSGCEVNKV